MTPKTQDAVQRVHDYFADLSARSGDPVRVPPFSLLLDVLDPNPYRNYAVPDAGACPDDETVRALADAFRSRNRTPRLEYMPAAAPDLEARLLSHGFVRRGELPLMLCTPASLASPDPARLRRCRLAMLRTDLQLAARIQNTAFGEGPETEADTDRLQRTLEQGGFVALVMGDGGEPVGSGLVTGPVDGVAEIAAIGVLEPARRAGAGSAVAAFLAEQALAAGVDLPFLMAEGLAEARIYQRIGFTRFSTMIHMTLEGG